MLTRLMWDIQTGDRMNLEETRVRASNLLCKVRKNTEGVEWEGGGGRGGRGDRNGKTEREGLRKVRIEGEREGMPC